MSTEQERRELAYQHRGEVVEGSGVAVEPRQLGPAVDLDAIRARAEAATPGPWTLGDPNEGSGHLPLWCVANDAYDNPLGDDDEVWPAVNIVVETGTREDAEFIVHARADIPALLAEVDRLNAAHAEVLERLHADYNERFNVLSAELAPYHPPLSGKYPYPTYDQIVKAWQDTLDQQDEWRQAMKETSVELNAAEAKVAAVLALHSPEPGWEAYYVDPAEALEKGWPMCAGCATQTTSTPIGKCRTRKTIKAIEEATNVPV